MSKHPFAWPNGRRIAVAVKVMLETWSEGKPPPYGVQATPLKPGTIDHGGIAWGSYGGKVGVWRIIDLLNRHHLARHVLRKREMRRAISRSGGGDCEVRP
jgi:hypothetical protein